MPRDPRIKFPTLRNPSRGAPAVDPAASMGSPLGVPRVPWGELRDLDGAVVAVVDLVDISVSVDGLAVSAAWSVRFRNTTSHQLDAMYVFPLPAGAAVVGASATFADRVVKADLAERDAARAVFDAAVAAGRRAGLVEADRSEVFTLTLGRLAPGENPEVRLELVASLDVDLGVGSWRVPLVVAPRYSPAAPAVRDGAAHGTTLDPDASRVQSPRTGELSEQPPVQLSVRWADAVDESGESGESTPAQPRCSVNGADWIREEHAWSMRWQGPADRDVIVSNDLASLFPTDSPARAVCFARPGGGHVVRVDLGLRSSAGSPDAARRGRDVSVVLDRSGSMDGWKMIAAQRLASRLVDSLTAADRVLVIGFDNQIERSDTQLAAADAPTRRRVGRFIDGLGARGGTELASAITSGCAALHERRDDEPDDRDRVLVLVTDAQVSDEANTTNALAARLGDAQVYVVGVDRAVNAGLCRNLATVGGGRFELVTDTDEVGAALDRVVARVGRPILRHVTATVGGAPARLLPRGGVDVFDGAVATLWTETQANPDGSVIECAGEHAQGPWRLTAPVRPASDSSVHAKLWAHHELTALEAEHQAGDDAASAHAVALSLAAGVLCRFTAYVAVDHAGLPLSGDSVPVIQPLAQPSGWGGAPQMLMAAAAPMPASTAASTPPPGAAGGRADAAPSRAEPLVVAVGAGLRRRIDAVLRRVDTDPSGSGERALSELLDDLATLNVPQRLVELLRTLADALRARRDPSPDVRELRDYLASIS